MLIPFLAKDFAFEMDTFSPHLPADVYYRRYLSALSTSLPKKKETFVPFCSNWRLQTLNNDQIHTSFDMSAGAKKPNDTKCLEEIFFPRKCLKLNEMNEENIERNTNWM